ncbi:class I SAM-dependent methyltransferase [Verrucomicrobiaceae bacterium N1E253]|uniref:Class I SAM-dependent methyltransferase n=1 Tax=Oceaniferula marina TaxID=2748318 RepID=A0A851GJD9_9BACT|nr:class I SAM-dependent methyltransferase [Oceaniferula marina]NWK54790.1 class I SAM-dependent methyltransferase [Oceaniferula marina]
MKELAETTTSSRVESILDVGCGDGSFLRQLIASSPEAKRVVGVDIVDPRTLVPEDLLNHPVAEWVTAYGHQLPFPDDSFDLVCIARVLHHLPGEFVELTLNEMKRVLKPGGEFMVCEMYSDQQRDAQMGYVFYHQWLAEVDRYRGIHHYDFLNRNAVVSIIDSLGLVDCQMEDYNEEYTAEQEQQEMAIILERVDQRLQLAEGYEELERLKQEAQSIHVWMLTHGLAMPTRLIASGHVEV